MHLAQEEYGHMSQEAMEDVAGVLDLDPTHVLSLAGFYTPVLRRAGWQIRAGNLQ